MHALPVATVSSGWAAFYLALAAAIGGAVRWGWDRWRIYRGKLSSQAKREAEAPERELTVAAQAAQAVAAAAADLLAPFQETVRQQARELGELREAMRLSRLAEAACRDELASVRAELNGTKSKVREVTDHLGLDPDGHEDADAPPHPMRRKGDKQP